MGLIQPGSEPSERRDLGLLCNQIGQCGSLFCKAVVHLLQPAPGDHAMGLIQPGSEPSERRDLGLLCNQIGQCGSLFCKAVVLFLHHRGRGFVLDALDVGA
jgi:hypothetical protein